VSIEFIYEDVELDHFHLIHIHHAHKQTDKRFHAMYMHSLLFVWGQNQNSWLSFSNFLCLGVKCGINCILIALIFNRFRQALQPGGREIWKHLIWCEVHMK